MANILIGFDNQIDSATLAGGSWNGALPLANLKDRRLALVARSTNAATASTIITVDLGSAQEVRVVGLVNHNMTIAASFLLEGSTSSSFSPVGYTSGSVLAWPAGTVTAETDLPRPTVGVALSATYRYWRISITDTGNPAGYIQLGRVFIGGGFDPVVNYAYGASRGYESATTIETSLSGAEYFGTKALRRVMRFSCEGMTDLEGYEEADELVRRSGIDGEVFVIADSADTAYRHRRDFMGRLRSLSPLEQSFYDRTSMNFEVAELL